MTTSPGPTARWLPLREAAALLGESPVTLRRRCASDAVLVDGVQEARFDGLVARRLGGTWRMYLPPQWTDPLGLGEVVLPSPPPSARRDGRSPT